MTFKVLAFAGLGLIGLMTQGHAQYGPCYSADQCRALRYNQQMALQRQQEADAEARRESIRQQAAAQRQAAQDEADRQAAALARQRAIDAANAAQYAAEVSPDNRCHNPLVAGELIKNFNSLSSDANTPMAVDIEHLTTRRYESVSVYACRGVFVLSNGQRVSGVLFSRLNVANDPIVSFSTAAF